MSHSVSSTTGPRTDSLAASVVMLLGMAFLQRIVGFVRSVLFCDWLHEDQLGEWDVAYGFLFTAAPIAVLGLPGSFGRYLEYYRQQGQLHAVLRRVGVVSAVSAVGFVALVGLAGPWFSQLIFGQPNRTEVVWALAFSLVFVIAYNFLTELLTALRLARLVSVVQFVNSIAFAVLGIGLLCWWQPGAAAVVLAFGGAALIGGLFGLAWLRPTWREMPADKSPLPQRDLWVKLLPYAGWMWIGNLLFNLFEVADRYMLIHYSNYEPQAALAAVGNYHSSRVIPLLLLTAAMLLGGLITPHLSHDWEAGRKEAVSRRLNLALKCLGLFLFAASVGVLICGPLLFNVILHGKFSDGFAVLPWTLTYCVWFGIATVAQNYLWCAERSRLASVALVIGLVILVLLNLWWVPRFGLMGAVWATAIAKFCVLHLLLYFNWKSGMAFDRGLCVINLLPIALAGGPWLALGVLAAVSFDIVRNTSIFTADEKQIFNEALRQRLARFRRTPASPVQDIA